MGNFSHSPRLDFHMLLKLLFLTIFISQGPKCLLQLSKSLKPVISDNCTRK